MILALAVRITPASAQAAPALAVDPDTVNVPLGNQFVLEVTVTDGENVNGFDLKLTYDPGLLSLLSWAHGGYLDIDPQSSCSYVNVDKLQGLLELDCAQVTPDAADEEAALLELTFNTTALGTSNITLEKAVFVDDQGQQSEPERVNGVVNIQNLPTWAATATVTPSPTLTPTQAPPTITMTASTTPTPMPSPTDTQRAGTLTPTWTPTPGGTPTLEGTTTKTLTTPISGVAGPSQRTGTITAVFTLTPPEDIAGEMPEDSDGVDEDREEDLADSQETPGRVLWGRLLLGAGVLLFVALVVLILMRIRQRKRKNEDLLL
jgi:hypothetical protein